ncbi:hypothetical protein KZZ08_21205 [Roseovarius mucosus]|uniref:hypothetical protein n=1 Tax=Roseovarius mucosus TaxID=215743 RepID=UPI0012FCE742|nr:hypothetical protein [Roseovarius mucosus]MBW4976147.1 hypothetical protein [Roseovarius mucosus]
MALLLGAQLQGQDFSEPWIGAGILLTALGRGSDDLTPDSAARFPFFDVDYTSR